jgi:hypothetical protein
VFLYTWELDIDTRELYYFPKCMNMWKLNILSLRILLSLKYVSTTGLLSVIFFCASHNPYIGSYVLKSYFFYFLVL